MQQCKTEQLLYQIRMPLGDKNKAQLFQHAVLLSMESWEGFRCVLPSRGAFGHAFLRVIIYLCCVH